MMSKDAKTPEFKKEVYLPKDFPAIWHETGVEFIFRFEKPKILKVDGFTFYWNADNKAD